MTPEILDYLRYGALAISAFCIFLSFFLVYKGDRSNLQVFGFMIFAVVIFLGSLVADPNSGLFRLTSPDDAQDKVEPETVSTSQTTSSQKQLKSWNSGWFEVEIGKEYQLQHDMTSYPLTATIWYRRKSSSDIHMMDGIFENGGGYGAWIMDLNDKSMVISTGVKSSSSGYGRYNHWTAIDQGAESGSQPRWLRVVVTY